MGIISIKCVITRVSDSRAPGPLEKRAPLLSAEARRGILSMPVNAPFNATIPFSFLKADPWKFEMSPFPPFVSSFYFSFISLFPLFFIFERYGLDFFPLALLELIVKKQRKKSTRCPFSRLSKRRTVERIKFPFLAIASKTNQILAADMNARG